MLAAGQRFPQLKGYGVILLERCDADSERKSVSKSCVKPAAWLRLDRVFSLGVSESSSVTSVIARRRHRVGKGGNC
ncbi:hypothetical protein PQG02_21705 [Nostoc sp. UHCC 0926]|nr:hypothetical protein PQG02_21705 [Nostoc sp. UHCC 0926]